MHVLLSIYYSRRNYDFAFLILRNVDIPKVRDIHRAEEVDDVRDCLFKVIYKCNYNAQADYEHILKNVNHTTGENGAEGTRFSEQDLHNAKEKMEKVRKRQGFPSRIFIMRKGRRKKYEGRLQ